MKEIGDRLEDDELYFFLINHPVYSNHLWLVLITAMAFLISYILEVRSFLLAVADPYDS